MSSGTEKQKKIFKYGADHSQPTSGAETLPTWIAKPDPKVYLNDDYICADFETTNKNKGSALNRNNRLVLATWLAPKRQLGSGSDLHNSIRSQFGDEYHQGRLLEDIRSSRFLVAHNSKFELQWLARCGLESGSVLVWDTMLAEFVIAGNRRWDLSLEGTARRYGLHGKQPLVKQLIASGICPSEIPEKWLLEYCAEDTLLCHAVFLRQRQAIVELGLLPTVFTRCLLTPVLADIEMRGVQLDARKVEHELTSTRDESDRLRKELDESFGGINWRSSKQLGDLIYGSLGFAEIRRGGRTDRTDGGKPRTDEPTITALKATSSKQRHFQERYVRFRKLLKRQENLEKLKLCCEADGGRLYAQYNQAVAGTHRLTSSGLRYKVQFQNIDHTLKYLFCPSTEGWYVGEADGVQLEFRVAAHLGRDPAALADIRSPTFDVHWQTAEAMAGKPRTELTKDHRRDAKPSTFRPLYGGSAGNPALRRYIKFFQKKYKGIYDTQTGWTYEVLRNKKLVTETGLIFYWPDTKLEDSADGRGYIRNRTAIFNYPVQSLATADIIPIALIYFWHRAKAQGLKLFVVNTVHDSIIAEVPKDESEAFRDLSNRCFTVDVCDYLSSVYGIHFRSPLGVASKLGASWGEGEEVKYEYDPEQKQAA